MHSYWSFCSHLSFQELHGIKEVVGWLCCTGQPRDPTCLLGFCPNVSVICCTALTALMSWIESSAHRLVLHLGSHWLATVSLPSLRLQVKSANAMNIPGSEGEGEGTMSEEDQGTCRRASAGLNMSPTS